MSIEGTWKGAEMDQMGLMHADECLMLNDADEVIGHASKYDCHRVGHQLFNTPHRAFSVFLFNERNELLLQQRAASKITFPLVWTNTCCSHPLWAQTPDETEPAGQMGIRRAAQRKLFHELGLPAEYAPVGP